MKATPISQQPVNRFSDMHWPKDDQNRLNDAVHNYFKVAIAENGTDAHGSKLLLFEEYDPDNITHTEVIFKRDFQFYCENHDVKPLQEYIPDFIAEYTAKWQDRLGVIRHPKYKRYIRTYISYLNTQKDAEMEASEALRRKLGDAGFIGETAPDVFHQVIKFHQLPGDAKPVLWKRSKADAMYFFKKVRISTADANQCFKNADDSKFHDRNFPKNEHKQKIAFQTILP